MKCDATSVILNYYNRFWNFINFSNKQAKNSLRVTTETYPNSERITHRLMHILKHHSRIIKIGLEKCVNKLWRVLSNLRFCLEKNKSKKEQISLYLTTTPHYRKHIPRATVHLLHKVYTSPHSLWRKHTKKFHFELEKKQSKEQENEAIAKNNATKE